MNCRKVSGLLSAYLDQELTGEEMLAIRAHLDGCTLCRSEYQSLADTKRLLASLALQTPRAELEDLLLSDAVRASRRPALYRAVSEWLSDWFATADIREVPRPAATSVFAVGRNSSASGNSGYFGGRLRPALATTVLSLAGLWLATTSLNGPHDEAPQTIAPEANTGLGVAAAAIVLPPLQRPAGPVAVIVPVEPLPVAASGAMVLPPSRSPDPLMWSSDSAGSPAVLLSRHRYSVAGNTGVGAPAAMAASAFQLVSHRR